MSKLKRAKSLIGKIVRFRDTVSYSRDELEVLGIRFGDSLRNPRDDDEDMYIRGIVLRVKKLSIDYEYEIDYRDRKFEIVR